MGKLIECKNLSVRLQGKCLYENLNFTVNESDRYIFWGPNGAGKSLLLKLIHLGHNGLLAEKYKGLAVSGQILDKNGRDLINPSAEERKIAYVSQEEIFRKNETVKEMCQMSCYGMGVELDEERFDFFLREFGLYDKKNKRISNNLSSGEAKIIHIISRLLTLKNVDLLLLDEPLNHLSFENSKTFNRLMLEEINKNPKLGIVMVSHCKAVTFPNKAIKYDSRSRTLADPPYQSYDCFSDEEE